MTNRRPCPSIVKAVPIALLLAGAPEGGSQPARYWCHDYTLSFVTGKETKGTSARDLREALMRSGYRADTFADVVAAATAEAKPGDVLVIGDMHSGVFVSDRMVRHYFGETYAEAKARTWSLSDFGSFARTRNPETGETIPAIRPFEGRRVEIWRRPVGPLPTKAVESVANAARALPADSTGASPGPSASPTLVPTVRPASIAAGRPAAWHVFATGSRLGWAGGLGRYSVGPADRSIVEHLQAAGEHAMWANRESRPPTLAWPGWVGMRASFQSWADNLQRNPSIDVRRQIAIDTSGNIPGYAQALSFQTVGTTESRVNCEAIYVQLGFRLAYGAQVLQIADEAARNGDRRAAQVARTDALGQLSSANSLLLDYEKVILASGSCADLREVRARLQGLFALRTEDVAAQASAATSAWELANERIAAMSGASPGAQTAGPGAQPTQPGRPATLPAGGSRPSLPPNLVRFAAILDDPGELEGYWAGPDHVLRFSRAGDEYVGTFEKAPLPELAYTDGEAVFRGRRVGANEYRGSFTVHRRRRLADFGPVLETGPDGKYRYVYDAVRESEPTVIAVLGSYLSVASIGRRNPLARPGSLEASARYRDFESRAMRIAGPAPLTLIDGRSLTDMPHLALVHRCARSDFRTGCVLHVARGRSAGGQEAWIAFPDLDAMSPKEIAGIRTGSVGNVFFQTAGPQAEGWLRRDPLSAEWVERRGFEIQPGLTNLGYAALVAGIRYPDE